MGKKISFVTVFCLLIFSCINVYAIDADTLYKECYNKVEECKLKKSQVSVNEARKKIDSLKNTPASWAIGEFSKQVDNIQHPILVQIVSTINKSAKKLDIYEVERTKKIIKELPNLSWAGSYSSALDKQVGKVIEEVSKCLDIFKKTRNGENLYRVFDSLAKLGGSEDKNILDFIDNVKKEVNSTRLIEEDKLVSDVSPELSEEVKDFDIDGKNININTLTIGQLRYVNEADLSLDDYSKNNYFYTKKLYYLSLLNSCKKLNIRSVKKEYGCSFLAGCESLEDLTIFPSNSIVNGKYENIPGIELGDYSKLKKAQLIRVGDDQISAFKNSIDLEWFDWTGTGISFCDKSRIDFNKFKNLYTFIFMTEDMIKDFNFIKDNSSIDTIELMNLYKESLSYDDIYKSLEALETLPNLKHVKTNMWNDNKNLKLVLQDLLPNAVIK